MMDKSADIEQSGICLISLSGNGDHQDTLYSMFDALYGDYKVITIGAKDPVYSNAPKTPDNHYVDCPLRPGICRGTFSLKNVNDIVRIILGSGCKTVYFESVHLWNCFIMAKLGKRYTLISTLHDVVPHDGSRSVMLCQKLQCALSDRVVIKSSQFIDDAKRLYGLSDRKLIVCNVWRHYPVYRGPGNGRKLLFFGRLRKYKGLDDIARIAESCPDIEFLVVGSPDNESLPFVEEISKMQNVEVEARLVSDSEMKRSFELASWVLLPYESASQSGVIIDSYKYGKPVIAYSVGAVSSQVVDGKTGFLIPAGDIASFIAAVNHVTSISDEEYESFSKEAYKFGYENYAAESRCVSFAKKFNIELVDEDADRQEACRNVDAHRKAKKART